MTVHQLMDDSDGLWTFWIGPTNDTGLTIRIRPETARAFDGYSFKVEVGTLTLYLDVDTAAQLGKAISKRIELEDRKASVALTSAAACRAYAYGEEVTA